MLRVCLGYKNVAGYLSALRAGFEVNGVDVLYATLSDNPYAYDDDHKGRLVRSITWLIRWRDNSPCPALYIAPLIIMKCVLALRIVLTCDAVITPGDSTLLRGWEWRLYRLFNVRFIPVFLGSDCRPPYISGAHMLTDAGVAEGGVIARHTLSMRRYIRRVEKHATHVVADRASAHFFSQSFVDYWRLGFPRLLPARDEVPPGENMRTVIVHAPSRPKQKGTDTFRHVVETLVHEGYDIEYIELIGVPNAKVVEALSRCDFVLDELYSDLALAGFSSEAAVFAKPAVIGSYRALPSADRDENEGAPSVFVAPEAVEAAVRKLLDDAAYRRDMGKKARLFLEENWAADKVAAKYEQLIKGKAPGAWSVFPEAVDYIYGWGVGRGALRAFLQKYIADFGGAALGLEDKPVLRKRFIDFAAGRDV